MVIEFDGTQINNDYVTSISYDSKMLNDNDTFTLGQTVCDTLKLTVAKEDIETQPDIVIVNGKDYIVDNIEEDDTSYIYTLTDYMVNFNFRYDAQPLIEASEHTETDGTKYVTLLELVQDICSQANLELITEDFIGNDKHITWYDNTITAREYIGMVAELNGGYAVIDEGLVFKRLTNGEVKSITEEGNITIEDGTDTSLVGCNIEGNSYQEGTPTPDNPQEVEVVETYNLLNINREEGVPSNTASANTTPRTFNLKKLVKGLSWNNYYNSSNVNSYTINGNSLTVNNNNIYGIGFPLFLQSGSYTLSYSSTSISDVYIAKYKTDGTPLTGYYSQNKPVGNVSYTFTIDSELVVVPIFSSHTANTDITFTNIQLEESTTASEYILYNNIGVNVLGKNLFDSTQPVSNDNLTPYGITYTINNGVYTCNGTNTATFKYLGYDITLEAGTYILSGCPSGGSSNGYSSFTTFDGNYYFDTGNGVQFTLAETRTISIYPIRIGSETVTMNNLQFKPMIRKASITDATFEPYTLITTPIDLQGNFIGKIGNIKDELNIDDLGNVILTKRIGKVVLDGTESGWYQTADTNVSVFVLPSATQGRDRTQSAITKSNYFIYQFANTVGRFYYSSNNNDNLAFCMTNTYDLAGLKTWLGTHNTEVYYVLETPYTVNLGKANIELNEGVNYITFLTGLDTRNTIEYTSQSGEYEIDIEDCEDYKIGDYHKITRVAIENGIFEPVGTEEGNTLYLNANNVYITEQNDLNNIYTLVRGFEYYSLEIKKGDLNIVPTGKCIALVIDKPYKTYSQIEANYNGGYYGKYHFITGSNKQEETAVYNGTEDNYKRLKFELNRDKNEINILVEKTDTLSTNIDEETGDVRAVTTSTGFTFNSDGLNISRGDTTYNTLIDNTGMFNKDGETTLAQFTKEGAKIKDLDIFGYNKYGEDEITDEPMFVAILYTNENNEEGYGHFYNR